MKKAIITLSVVLFCLALILSNSYADDKYWFGGTGDWEDPSNWDPVGIPVGGDNVYVTNNTGENETISYTGSGPEHGRLSLYGSDNRTMTLSILNGRLDFDFAIGGLGGFSIGKNGIVNHTGGGVGSVASIHVETEGKYNLDGDAHIHIIGSVLGVSGEFNQKNGDAIADDIWVSFGGTYNLSGGRAVSYGGEFGIHGVFNQTGGSAKAQSFFNVYETGAYNLSNGVLDLSSVCCTVSPLLTIGGTFNYTGGEISFNKDSSQMIDSDGIFYLSGDGTRVIDGNFVNKGTWESENTTVSYKGNFTNNESFNSENSVQYFTNLTIGDDGHMTGSGNAPWFVKEALLGVSITDDSVTNIFGEHGFNAYYNPIDAGNQYLGGLDYNLSGEGILAALDGIVTIDQYLMTDPLTLDETFSFDTWWEMGEEPNEFNFDILFFHDDEWTFLGGDINFDGSSTEWETLSFLVPHWARGLETQIKFVLADLGQYTDPTVYLRNVGSNPVPEPSTMLLLSTGLIGLAGWGRKKFKKN